MLFLVFRKSIGTDLKLKSDALHSLLPMVTSAAGNSITNCRSEIFQILLTFASSGLPIRIVNVVLVPDEWRAKQNVESEIGIIFNGIVAKFSGGELVTCLALDLACR